ncbi:hypothetical protein HDV00_002250 [Rhizophlyctis rosea]|nr:hypothetical protein HDV00_002250 [Rhizophlyctis rosea]
MLKSIDDIANGQAYVAVSGTDQLIRTAYNVNANAVTGGTGGLGGATMATEHLAGIRRVRRPTKRDSDEGETKGDREGKNAKEANEHVEKGGDKGTQKGLKMKVLHREEPEYREEKGPIERVPNTKGYGQQQNPTTSRKQPGKPPASGLHQALPPASSTTPEVDEDISPPAQNDAQSIYESENVQEMRAAKTREPKSRNQSLADGGGTGATSRKVRKVRRNDGAGHEEGEGSELEDVEEEVGEGNVTDAGGNGKVTRRRVIRKRKAGSNKKHTEDGELEADDDEEEEVVQEAEESHTTDGRQTPSTLSRTRTPGTKSVRRVGKPKHPNVPEPDADETEEEASSYEDDNRASTAGDKGPNRDDRDRGDDDVEQGKLVKSKSKIPLPKLPAELGKSRQGLAAGQG